MVEFGLIDGIAFGATGMFAYIASLFFVYVETKRQTKREVKEWVRNNYKRDL